MSPGGWIQEDIGLQAAGNSTNTGKANTQRNHEWEGKDLWFLCSLSF